MAALPPTGTDPTGGSASGGHRSPALIIESSRVTTRAITLPLLVCLCLVSQEAGPCGSGSCVSSGRQVREEVRPELSEAQAQHQTRELTPRALLTSDYSAETCLLPSFHSHGDAGDFPRCPSVKRFYWDNLDGNCVTEDVGRRDLEKTAQSNSQMLTSLKVESPFFKDKYTLSYHF